MIPFPVFVILKLKTFGWCARQQKQQTPLVTNTPHTMPGQGNQNICDLRKSRLGFVLNTKAMYHHYA
jgi:hypothetical protein